MELIALLLLAPLLWSQSPTSAPGLLSSLDSDPSEHIVRSSEGAVSSAIPHIESIDGRFIVHPPADPALTMTVLEQHTAAVSETRGPASVTADSRHIDVIVSAP